MIWEASPVEDGRSPELLRPVEVARLFRVSAKTVVRWATDGKLRSVRTLGGHRRFFADDVRELLRREDRPPQ